MRIAHVVIGGEVAGGQMVARRLARAALDAGHDVSFVSPTDGPFLDLVRAAGMCADVVPISGALDLAAVLRLSRTFRKRRVELVHTHGQFGVNVAARTAGRLVGAAVLSHIHIENTFRAGAGRGMQIALDNATARLCFAIVAVSDATRESVVRQGYPARVVTVRNGIDPVPPVAPVRLFDGRTVLEVARLARVKGQGTLLGALRSVEAGAVLVGRDLEEGGAYRRLLESEALRLGVAERVVFAGYREDVAALIAGCDVFCLPSFAEGLPLVLLEAMAHGKPVVATPVGGTPELVVDGVTGLLVPPGDEAALAEALGRVLSDDGLARRLGEAGRARVEREFSAERAVQRVLSLYGRRS